MKSYKRTLKLTITEAERKVSVSDSMNKNQSCGSIFDENVGFARENLGSLKGQGNPIDYTGICAP